ncbi:MAG: DUF493 family protein [Pseudoxanthomonas suwonensis]|nr:DUF493 family protein [Pseudoxanthomonas suwonensis]
MDIHSDNPEHGFQFPGEFELTAMGAASANLPAVLPALLADAGVRLVTEDVQTRASSAGNYVSVRLRFHAESREQYEAAHAALRAHPEVKWTL